MSSTRPLVTGVVMTHRQQLRILNGKVAIVAAVAGLALARASFADAPSDAKPVDPQTVQRLIERVDRQDAEIKELKAKLATPPPAASASDPLALRLDKQEPENGTALS